MSGTRLSVFIALSVDGYIATRDGSLAWLEEAARSDEDYGYESFLASVDALAMGRGTYGERRAAARGCPELAERLREPHLLATAERLGMSDLRCPATVLIARQGEAEYAVSGVFRRGVSSRRRLP